MNLNTGAFVGLPPAWEAYDRWLKRLYAEEPGLLIRLRVIPPHRLAQHPVARELFAALGGREQEITLGEWQAHLAAARKRATYNPAFGAPGADYDPSFACVWPANAFALVGSL